MFWWLISAAHWRDEAQWLGFDGFSSIQTTWRLSFSGPVILLKDSAITWCLVLPRSSCLSVDYCPFSRKKGGEEVSFDRPVTQASKVLTFAETEFSGVLEGALCLW